MESEKGVSPMALTETFSENEEQTTRISVVLPSENASVFVAYRA